MRSKFAIYNSITAAMLQAFLLIQGLIIPRLVIEYYGSDINGLIYGSQQVFNQLNYIEAGFYLAFMYILFKPLNENNNSDIKQIFNMIKLKYKHLSTALLFFVLMFAFIYPVLLGISFSNYFLYFVIILLVGFANVLNIYLFYKYRPILIASQKEYVLSLSFIVSVLFSILVTYALVLSNFNIVIVRIVPIFAVLLRSLIIQFYMKRRSKLVVFDHKEEGSCGFSVNIDKIYPAIVFQIATSISVIIPAFIISIISTLEVTSVFSVYNSIFFGLIGISGIFVVGIPASLGNMYANNETKLMKVSLQAFETFISIVSTVLYAAFALLVTTFIKIYISFDSDISYFNEYYPLIFAIWGIIHNLRIVPSTYIMAVGKFKSIQFVNTVYIISIISMGFAFGYIFNYYASIIIVIILTFIRNIVFYIDAKNDAVFAYNKSTLKFLLSIAIVCMMYFANKFIDVTYIENVFDWVAHAVIIVTAISIVVISFYYFMFKNDILYMTRKIISGIKSILGKGNENV